MSGHYIQLSANVLRFDPVTRDNSVFFDEANKQVRIPNSLVIGASILLWNAIPTATHFQVFAVSRFNGKTEIVVRGPDVKAVSKFEWVGFVLSSVQHILRIIVLIRKWTFVIQINVHSSVPLYIATTSVEQQQQQVRSLETILSDLKQ